MAMSVTVKKSSPVVVRPSDVPVTTSNTVKLSSFDKALTRTPVTALFVFEQPIHEPAETIKMALSQAMVHYYPISGRLAAGGNDDDDELHIKCTGEGVQFVAASCNSTLKEVKLLDQSPGAKALVDEPVLYAPAVEVCGPYSNPLMTMQVTEFSCGGFIIAVTWNHAIADGFGIAQFLQAVGEFARGLSQPSVVPIRWDDSLPSLPASTVAWQQLLLLNSFEALDLAQHDVTIPSSVINRIRAEYRASSNGQSCTTFEVVAAVIWQCRTRAIMSNPEAPAVLSFTANIRRHVGAKDGYYGNCSIAPLVTATNGIVANGDIANVINLIKDAKDQIAHQFKRDGIIDCNNQQPEVDPQQLNSEVLYSMLALTSWRNIGFEDPDFGSGKPSRVMYNAKPRTLIVPGCVVCLPWKGLDGASVSSVCVKNEHAQAFLGELARFT
ncbi:hypothetical protein PR202_gb22859 [Eleusine coracana subsp. coracana]|uniref:Uncharacterized protein n=1 Tax=Eleusine coracana subsp. coracana TaxID=191504 RepID=A0AAV5FES1_ELECO|nr:hypothetical protein PR202_gb22859 [Eleusine coracana subsp. coracana]